MRWGNLRYRRVDPFYHHPKHKILENRIDNCPYPKKTIGQLCEPPVGGATPSRDDSTKYANNGIHFIRINNVKSNQFDLEDVKYITSTVHDGELRRSKLAVDDVLMTITGRVGTAAVVIPDLLPANINQHIVRLRMRVSDCSPQYLAHFLNTETGTGLSNRYVTGGTRIALDYGAIRDLSIPVPPQEIQNRFVDAMQTAYAKYSYKLSQANLLLSTMDEWLLEKLGISLTKDIWKRSFSINLRIAQKRFDVAFHSPKFRAVRENIEKGIHPTFPLGLLCNGIKSGFAAGKQDQANASDSGIPHLRPLNLNIYGEISLVDSKYVPSENLNNDDYCKYGEVLFNNTNSEQLVGKSAVFDIEDLCACSNHMTRLSLKSHINPYYIASVLNALRSIGYLGLLSTNFVNQAGINTETLAQLIIPLPDPNTGIQEEVEKEILLRRSKARKLRIEAEEEWIAAKAYFEEQLLLGDES